MSCPPASSHATLAAQCGSGALLTNRRVDRVSATMGCFNADVLILIDMLLICVRRMLSSGVSNCVRYSLIRKKRASLTT